MDLFAYTQISALQPIADYNGISIPRLRGYRLMEYEKPVTAEEMTEMLTNATIYAVKQCCSMGFIYSDRFFFMLDTTRLEERYLVKNPRYLQENESGETDYREYVGIRWDRLHGKKRKRAKHEIKQRLARIRNQYSLFNRYAGKPGILYAHSRIGGANWNTYKNEVIQHPGFIERTDDCYDNTYCDLYYRVEIPESIPVAGKT